jgi:hypothetical protein
VAELVATLTGKPLPAIEESGLFDAIANAGALNELASPGPDDPVWTELPRMVDDASMARDLGLHSALYAVEDSLRLAERHSDSGWLSRTCWKP